MDVASGVFAVISLSLQLAETVKKVDNFLRDVQNAPDELRRLVDTLDQFNLILVQVKTYVEQQSRIDGLPGCIDVIERTLHSCESNVRKLDSYVNVFQTLFNGKGQRRKIWASIKTVVKKEEIVQMRGLILQDISSLQAAMLINMSYLQLHQLRTYTHCQPKKGQHSQLKDITADTESLEMTRSSGMIPRNSHIRTKETEIWAYRGWFGHVTARSKTKSLQSEQRPETEVSQERSIFIALNLIRKAFEIRYCGTFGLLPRSLSCFPVLPWTSDVVLWCIRGDVDSLKDAFTRREVSPLVTDQWGNTLLHHAARHLDLCRLLIQLGVDPDHTNRWGSKAMHDFMEYESHLDTLRLLTTEEFTLDNLSECLSIWCLTPHSPEALDFLLSAYPFPDELRQKGALEISPLTAALRCFGAGEKKFEGSIRKFLRQGFDVHLQGEWASTDTTETLLDALFYWHENPFDQSDEAQAWLSILKEEGYDVDTYMDKEVELRSGQDHLSCSYSRSYPVEGVTRRLIIRNGQHPNVQWDYSIDPSSGASLVRNEFQHMNLDHCDLYSDFEWMESIFRRPLARHNWEYAWPYVYPMWSDFHEPEQPWCSRSWIEWRKQADLAKQRFSHRMKKKKEKINKRPRMPGAWIQ